MKRSPDVYGLGGGVGVLPSVLAAVLAHAEAAYPEECCGALLGRPGGRGRVAVRAVPLENRASSGRVARYLIPGDVVRALEAAAGEAGLEVIGFYHSHPDGTESPSPQDRESAWPWYSYLIVGVADGRAGGVGGWRLREDRASFQAEIVEIGGEEE